MSNDAANELFNAARIRPHPGCTILIVGMGARNTLDSYAEIESRLTDAAPDDWIEYTGYTDMSRDSRVAHRCKVQARAIFGLEEWTDEMQRLCQENDEARDKIEDKRRERANEGILEMPGGMMIDISPLMRPPDDEDD